MDFSGTKTFASHGSGEFDRRDFRRIGTNVIFEPGVLVFHPENISLGDNLYVGHYTILKGYHRGQMEIGDDTWIGQNCFFHSAGGLVIGRAVGIGPGVKILTSAHGHNRIDIPVMHHPLTLGPVEIGDGADIGVGAIILPGVRIGHGAMVGAGAVVNRDIPDYAIAAGVPARIIKYREEIVRT